jgi:hypothetical protein
MTNPNLTGQGYMIALAVLTARKRECPNAKAVLPWCGSRDPRAAKRARVPRSSLRPRRPRVVPCAGATLLKRQPRRDDERLFVNRYGAPLGASGARFKLTHYVAAAANLVEVAAAGGTIVAAAAVATAATAG